jgi:hypothetical protein
LYVQYYFRLDTNSKYYKKTYATKLKNPLWQKRRLEVFQRDNWQCTNCNAIDKELHVHHLDYIDGLQPWEYPLDMLTTLCEYCHENENARPKHEKYLLQSLKMKGFLVIDILCLSTMMDRDQIFVHNLKKLIRREYLDTG